MWLQGSLTVRLLRPSAAVEINAETSGLRVGGYPLASQPGAAVRSSAPPHTASRHRTRWRPERYSSNPGAPTSEIWFRPITNGASAVPSNARYICGPSAVKRMKSPGPSVSGSRLGPLARCRTGRTGTRRWRLVPVVGVALLAEHRHEHVAEVRPVHRGQRADLQGAERMPARVGLPARR